MEKYSLFVVIFCATFMPMVLGFPYGNVSIACDSMLPDHGSAPQESTPPYVISVSFDKYDPGNEVQVILEGTSPSGFKGFMLQAREIHGDVPIGSFRITDPNSQGLSCANISNSAISHTSPNVKHQIKTTWVAPREAKVIQLVATFVQDYDTYWVGVRSKTLSPRKSEAVNDSRTDSDSNHSEIASDSITSVVSEITADPETAHENDGDLDFSPLFADSEADSEYETLADSVTPRNPKRGNNTERSRRKSVVSVKVTCGEGTSQSTGGSCIKNPQGTFQGSGSQSKVIVVKQGGSSGGCAGGAVAGVYGKYGCRDSAVGISDQSSSYGQSVSVGSKVKVVAYPDSKPFPPERDGYTSKIAGSKYTGVIQSQGSSSSKIQIQGGQISSGSSSVYSQGSRPQGGSSQDIRITIQGGPGSPACDKSSSSYNIQVCNQGQSSSSQSGSGSFGTQGQSSSSQSSSSSSSQSGSISSGMQQGGSYSSGSKPCGQIQPQPIWHNGDMSIPGEGGTTYDSNPCHQGQSASSQQSTYNNQASSQYQGNRNPCNQGQGAAYNYNKC